MSQEFLDGNSSVFGDELSGGRDQFSSPVAHRHGRSASVHSGMSSVNSSLAIPGSAGSHIPLGLNQISSNGPSLGSNCVAELVDGLAPTHTARFNEDSSASPAASKRSSSLNPMLAPNQIYNTVPFKAPTSRDIPPVVLTKIPKIQRDEFAKYLTDITQEYDAFYGTKFARGEHAAGKISSSPGGDDLASVISASMSNLSLADDDTVSPLPHQSPGPSANTTLDKHIDSVDESSTDSSTDLTPLSTIPDVFFEDNFQLDNPRVFDVVSERSQIIKPPEENAGLAIRITDAADGLRIGGAPGMPESRKVLLNNSILQEKLSWYIDTVELHLIREISNASASFFSALDDLKDIRLRASSLVERTDGIKKSLHVVDQVLAVEGIKNLKLRQRRKNVARLSQTLQQINLILTKSDEAESTLFGRNDAASCIDIIDGVEALIAGDLDEKKLASPWTRALEFSFPISDLRTVKGLDGLREALVKLRTKAGESYATIFTDILIKDLQRHVQSVSHDDTMNRLSKFLTARSKSSDEKQKKNTSYLEIDSSFRQKLQDTLHGLVRSGNVLAATKLYREAAIKEVKNTVRLVLPSKDDDNMSISSTMTGRSNAPGGGSGLAQALRDLSPIEVESMLFECYSSLSELFRRLLTQQKLLLDITLSLDDTPSGIMEINEILPSAVKITETRMSKVLKVRRDQVGAFNMHQFLNYYSLNGMYISECEALCGDPCHDLSGTLAVQIKHFVTSFHARQERDLTERMSKDVWKEVEISEKFQATVDRIVESGDKDPAQWTNLIRVVLSSSHYKEGGDENGYSDKVDEKKRPRNVFVESSSFIIANAAISTTILSESYLEAVVLLPHLSGEIVGNLIGLIRHFNSLTNSLILGAGATRSAGLKHITAKHLALASESLNYMTTMVGYMQKCCQRHCSSSSLIQIGEFGKVSDDLKHHQEEIHQKFITLMTDKVNMHCSTISKTNWSAPLDQQRAHKYMQDLVKETTILVKILKGILPRGPYVLITSKIFDIYKRQLLEAYTKVDFKSSLEKQNMLKDVELFKEKLGSVEGAGNCGDILYENIHAMPAPEPESFFDAGHVHDGKSEEPEPPIVELQMSPENTKSEQSAETSVEPELELESGTGSVVETLKEEEPLVNKNDEPLVNKNEEPLVNKNEEPFGNQDRQETRHKSEEAKGVHEEQPKSDEPKNAQPPQEAEGTGDESVPGLVNNATTGDELQS